MLDLHSQVNVQRDDAQDFLLRDLKNGLMQ